MKHSAQIKFPTKFLAASIFVCLLGLILTSSFVYISHKKSLEKKDTQNTSVVEQLNRQSYEQALDLINNK